MTDFKIKILPWRYSDARFIVKVKKRGNWFWRTVEEAEQRMNNDWDLLEKTFYADELNREKALQMFSCWQDYLDYEQEQVNIFRKNQGDLDFRRKEERKRLNNFYS